MDPGLRNFSGDTIDNLFTRHTFQDPIGYPLILDIVELRLL
jgi:hypothetical protein